MLKRKSPYGSMSPAPGSRGASVGVKAEGSDIKRLRGTMSFASAPPSYIDPRVVVLELRDYLKDRISMPYQDAFFHVQEHNPGVDVGHVLDLLKKQERVKFNETNQVFMYEPEIVLRTQQDLRRHIRLHSRPTAPLLYKDMKELMPGTELPQYMDELEKDGSIMILRSLTGRLKDAPLPPLGRENGFGEKLNAGGPERWKTIFYDSIRENGRATPRVEDEIVFAWADVKIAETDNVAKLLEEQDLKSSTSAQGPAKETKKPEPKKKKRGRRALKLTNTHMKDLGIDFGKDYEAPS
ncbi:hypothetical protein CcaverHIS002_0411100 [Cutaneotrichosporon cavernicola]|uniref:Transcription initiation factor IIE subunit beta n=1 Tax=Cutaneotrichosporon cavernicola TaxID=279322 RepID=A0AA48QWF0_9TREE|nr:uncharacterized protein CcaverHIS019_0411010 [Cutaneotrichosporon cavernicola]BEI84506.1 hypothetical protein CcaverHIS002_0411100 [Cutaneotrichosporon cavernicola]BEI92281.1 hypothetical protein CcaverHIS019_0411010 [Cutaneotrichosporon cavernicola]BEJ00053.1 hypothetical protein CcaverHIS631_0410950 [Cutaneotrichosporon cavernicola]BEJ07825.1 hypothetical protein CcaverHIS641_0410940 [Cutaneotrichosporon cavernicola]